MPIRPIPVINTQTGQRLKPVSQKVNFGRVRPLGKQIEHLKEYASTPTNNNRWLTKLKYTYKKTIRDIKEFIDWLIHGPGGPPGGGGGGGGGRKKLALIPIPVESGGKYRPHFRGKTKPENSSKQGISTLA